MIKYLLQLFTFLFCIIYNVNNAFATTLKEAIQLAYKNSEQVYMKSAQKDLSSIDRDTAIMNLLPQLEMSWTKMKANHSNLTIGEQLQQQITGLTPPTTPSSEGNGGKKKACRTGGTPGRPRRLPPLFLRLRIRAG